MNFFITVVYTKKDLNDQEKINKIFGREVGRAELPGTVSKGTEPPGRVEKTVVEYSESAGGKPDERHAKPGKRPPTRLESYYGCLKQNNFNSGR